MRIEIDSKILGKYGFTLNSFLTMLTGYYEIDLNKEMENLIASGVARKNLFGGSTIILCNEDKDIIARILTESNHKLENSEIDFEGLAAQLMDLYPMGFKPGTTYSWRGSVEEITQKLRVLVVVHDFSFTWEEAVDATREYTECFKENESRTKMKLLKNFLLQTKDGEIISTFMEYVENVRAKNKMNEIENDQ